MIFNIKTFLIGLLATIMLSLLVFVYAEIEERINANLFYIITLVLILVYFCFLIGNLIIVLFGL